MRVALGFLARSGISSLANPTGDELQHQNEQLSNAPYAICRNLTAFRIAIPKIPHYTAGGHHP